MAEYKQIKIRIWQDNWFLSLNPEEKLLWFYLLTNSNSHISGFYELPLIATNAYTGIKDCLKILNKFQSDGKIIYFNGWVLIKNYQKHQPISQNILDNNNKAINKYLEENKEIYQKTLSFEAPSKPLVKNTKPLHEIEIEIEREIEIEKEIEISEVDENRPKPQSPKEKANNFFNNEEFRNELANKIQEKTGVELKLILKEINNFCNYWLELNKLGTKRRWEMQQTFEVDRRLLTWFNNIDQFKKQTKGKTIIL
jgi:hypothetical protein